MRNRCKFSADRVYRYTLGHQFKRTAEGVLPRTLAVIGLNPSTADEQNLDPTLRKVRGFAAKWSYQKFIMLNLFAYRTKDPAEMRLADDPVGPDNDDWLLSVCLHPSVEGILCARGGRTAP